jgi:hypothetical protein
MPLSPSPFPLESLHALRWHCSEGLEDDDHHSRAQEHERNENIKFAGQEQSRHDRDPQDAWVGIILPKNKQGKVKRWREEERQREID